ncbi:MAG: 2-amino-4-hydroxy-6-hydroxymethyldihydropteridine diphosphokinase [Treponema sp.]|nr:2-amino-4-hydroxy-6-hydroxymethyldihydropteridine diphosphokinase [Treponema sp.]
MLVVLGLGSNKKFISRKGQVFEPVQVLENVALELKKELKNLKASSIWISEAMYYTAQSDFYNMVVCGNYDKSPENLLKTINKIEARWGRKRSKEIKNGPRSLDIDIELFGDLVVKTKKLIIPHEKITERAFVLLPLLEILPESAEPISGERFSDIYARLPKQNVQKISEVNYGRSIDNNISS